MTTRTTAVASSQSTTLRPPYVEPEAEDGAVRESEHVGEHHPDHAAVSHDRHHLSLVLRADLRDASQDAVSQVGERLAAGKAGR